MDTSNVARVDAAAVHGISSHYENAADVAESALRRFAGLTFDGSVAGREHTARGNALHAALTELAVAVRHWSHAGAEVAAALRASADRYVDADGRAAGRLG